MAVEGDADLLADLIYAPNATDGVLYNISISCAENSKDIFTFCLHMMMLGLARRQMYTNNLNLLAVTSSDIAFVQERLLLVGIALHHTQVPLARHWVAMGTNIDVIALMPDTLRLTEYVFKVYDGTNAIRHDIHFELARHD
jgi:hypothetical protein